MLKKTLMASAIAAATLASAGVQAQTDTPQVRSNNFSYTYGQFGYDNWDYDHGPDVDVLNGALSYEVDDHIFLRGSVDFYDGDYKGRGHSNVDGHRLSAGLGFHTPLQQGLDLLGTADLIRDDNDSGDHEWGYALRGGLRHQTTEALQLSGGVLYEDVYRHNFRHNIGVFGEGLVRLTQAWDVGARLSFTDDADRFGVFGRYNF